MKRMRQLMGRRMKAGALGVVLAYALLFQSLLGAVAQGAMAAPGQADAFAVLCSSHGIASAPQGDGDPAAPSVDCPCATLCRLGAMAGPVVPASAAQLDAPLLAELPAPPVASSVFSPPQFDPGSGHARAPPVLSV
ncbi:hypothetical protein GCM10007276_30040 [Agaricicola taiwanensis]|uniref:DUF2946 domain-containing protein n=1 Tax=Agaricicola taiwanensis TaxID=591372 RepID=A0A8J2YLH3_9RHOB|nr:hypothetical protein [Agaricicola taiwanensis]GGE51018.1 hypothetical protein GCM10007276_30040 [Agaricicola taiwanensis]